MVSQPDLTFFCELDAQPLEDLFADAEVIAALQQLKAGVAMGLRDLSEQRAAVIKQLNQASIPLTAWLLLPETEGYWFNLDNVGAAARQYNTFLRWSRDNGLIWRRIGLDIEPDFGFITGFKSGVFNGLIRVVGSLVRRQKVFLPAREAYFKLIQQIKSDGFEVEAYQLPLILDERLTGSVILQRILGVLDLAVNREIIMLYSSFSRSIGDGLLVSYGKDAEYIAVGSTGGGVDLEGVADTRPLTWSEFSHDLRIANRLSSEIAIFSLEGCIRQEFLNRLLNFDWELREPIKHRQIRQVELLRSGLRGLLWLSSRPLLPLALFAILLGWRFWRRRR